MCGYLPTRTAGSSTSTVDDEPVWFRPECDEREFGG